MVCSYSITVLMVSTHSRPKAAGVRMFDNSMKAEVSTHSRPKAAGPAPPTRCTITNGFNTQPPEGGWPSINAELCFI